ncbi:hypothetical protein QTP88_013968 [Uroleucon formosanum]
MNIIKSLALNIHTSVKNKLIYPNHPTWLWQIKINTELLQQSKHNTNPNIITSKFYEIIQAQYPHFTKIYTDASKSTHGIGFAISQYNITLLHKLPSETSIFTAETQAIYEAAILAKKITSNHILILNDSLSALSALQNSLPSNEITQHIQKILKSTSKKIELMWVPSHMGITVSNVLQKMVKDGLSFKNYRGQGYDNGTNIEGTYQDVHARLEEINEYAQFVPCVAHRLNLIGVHVASVSVKIISFSAQTLQEMCDGRNEQIKTEAISICNEVGIKSELKIKRKIKRKVMSGKKIIG